MIIYEMLSFDPKEKPRFFSSLESVVGCFEYHIEYYRGHNVRIIQNETNNIDEFVFTGMLAEYNCEDDEITVDDDKTEKLFKEKLIECKRPTKKKRVSPVKWEMPQMRREMTREETKK